MNYPTRPSAAGLFLVLAALCFWSQPAQGQGLNPPLKASGKSLVSSAQSVIGARFTYTSPAGFPKQAILNLYFVLFDLNKNADVGAFRLRTVRGPNAKVAYVIPMKPNQVVFAVVRAPNGAFTSVDPAEVGALSVQVNNGAATPVTLQAYETNSVVGFFNASTPFYGSGGG